MMPSKQITRRDFIRLGGLSAAWGALMACALTDKINQTPDHPPNLSATPAPGTSTAPFETELTPTVAVGAERATPSPRNDSFTLHTLRRLFFGFTPANLEQAQNIGIQDLLEEQLEYETLDDTPAENLVARLDLLKMSAQELYEIQPRGQIAGQFILSSIIRHFRSPRQVYEMMVDFWSNHFNIFLIDGITIILKIFDDRQVIRPYALTNFRELLHASAHSPAMLVYLDQATSTRLAPNENYARELLELHTIGVDGGYTQMDVQEVARTLTGWSVASPREVFRFNTDPGTFLFRPFNHDDGSKEVMGFEIPAHSGLEGGESLLDFLASHPSTAQFVARKLAQRFVADNPPDTIVKKLADTFEESNGDIKDLLRTLVASPEFAASAGGKFKRPLEFFVSLLISSQAEVSPNLRAVRALVEPLRLMGQVPHLWPAPDGYPDYSEWWATTSGMLNRWNFALQVSGDQIPGVRIPIRRLIADGGSAADVVDLLSLQFLGEILPSKARDILISYASDEKLDQAIPEVAGLILGSPYFQVR